MEHPKLIFAVVIAAVSFASAVTAADIHKAARKGDIDHVRELIADGADLQQLDKAVGSPLHWAAARGHEDVAQLLLENGADPNQKARAPDHLTPLHLAAAGGHVSLVKLLLQSGADVSLGEGTVGTPLHFAARADKDVVVNHLLDAGADPFTKASEGSYGVYPLHFAAQSGASGAIRAIVEYGFPINAANERTGATALHLAVFNDHKDAVKVLLDLGADPHAVSTNIETPLALAEDDPEMMSLFDAHEVK